VVPSNDGGVSVPVAHYLNSVDDARVMANHGGLDFSLGNSMKSAIIDAVTTKDDGTNKLNFTCPTGDCTFELDPAGNAYTSIGLCKKCVDITSLVREWPRGLNETTVKGSALNLTIEGMTSPQNSIATEFTGYWSSITSQQPTYELAWGQDSGSQNITYLTYTWAPCTINQTQPVFGGDEDSGLFYNWDCPTSIYPNIPHMDNGQAVLAVNCTFYPCIRSYNSRVETGILRETPVSEIRMKANESLFEDPGAFLEPCFIDGQPYDHDNISLVSNATGRNFTTLWTPQGTLQAPVECVYRMSYKISQALSQYFRTAFFGDNQCWWDSQNYSNNLSWVACPSEAWWLDSLYNRGFATFESVDSLLQNMSLAVSNQIRAHGTNANWTAPEFALGTMWNSTVCTRVDWAWMAFPISLELITLVLLVMVIVMSLRERGRQPIWKSSTLPLVFHGVRDGKDTVDGPEPVILHGTSPVSAPTDLAGMQEISKHLPVRLCTNLGSSGFIVDQGGVQHRKLSTTNEATPWGADYVR
jgi:hypothetical protein